MKKLLLLCGIPLLFVSISAVADASLLNVGDRIQLYDREGTTGGGAFGVRLKNSASPAGGDTNTSSIDLFKTFCVEKNEYIDFDAKGFVVDSISKFANAGGVGGPSPDPISDKTSWLYYRFRTGTLAGYDNTAFAGDQLQKAIWHLENEITLTSAQQAANAFLVAANSATASDLAFAASRVFVINLKWATDRSGFDGVWEKVNNVWTKGPGDNAQSQLYMIPEPGSLAIWGLIGLGCTLAAGRRRRENA